MLAFIRLLRVEKIGIYLCYPRVGFTLLYLKLCTVQTPRTSFHRVCAGGKMLAFKILMYRVINIGCLLAGTGEYRQMETNPVVQSLWRLEY